MGMGTTGRLRRAEVGASPVAKAIDEPITAAATARTDACRREPEATAAAILRECSDLDRVHLVLALKRTVKQNLKEKEATAYVSDLVKQIHPNSPHKRLTKYVESGCAVATLRSRLLPALGGYCPRSAAGWLAAEARRWVLVARQPTLGAPAIRPLLACQRRKMLLQRAWSATLATCTSSAHALGLPPPTACTQAGLR